MIQKPRFFILEEVVPKSVFQRYGDQSDKLWGCMDARVLWTADALRKRYGPMVANTWHNGGTHQYRGFRPFEVNLGAALSQHRYGRALDLVPSQTTAEEIRQDILKHPDWDEFKWIRCIEEGVSWLHFDCRNWIGSILVVKP